jgi:hypothetical protein
MQGIFEGQMKDNGVDGFEIIHLQENELAGLVLYTSWTSDYPDNRNEPGINYYQKQDGKWVGAMGTACGNNGVSRFGLMGNGYLYCSTLRQDMAFEKIMADGREANVFTFNGDMRVWFAITDSRDSVITGVSSNGTATELR